ncbi:MAG: U32 family peptidase [Zestosphaera sp.]
MVELLVGKETRKFLKKLGLPDHDLYELPTSNLRFPDGAHFRIEIPTVNTAVAMRAVLETTENYGVVVNRITETYGIMRHTDRELEEMVQLAKDFKVELVMSVGPRAAYDTSAQRATGTPEGARLGYRLRGVENLVYAIEDIKRALRFGVRGFLIYDEGMLWVVNEMRKAGELPSDIKFKLSAHCGHGNPASFKLFESLGADSINPARDLQLPMIAALRAAVKVPLDIHVDNPRSTGGFIRNYEAPEIVRLAAPVHIKTGNSAVETHGVPTTKDQGVQMALQAIMIREHIARYFPEAIQSRRGAEDLAIPR